MPGSLFLEYKSKVVYKSWRDSNIDSPLERQTRKKAEMYGSCMDGSCMDHVTADQKVVEVCFDV